ncbi:MAG: VWA domain-containing protein, partial [Chloroflexi bacterium]|nr:VWA domain-containing protein [Chloroflexota bacterium]
MVDAHRERQQGQAVVIMAVGLIALIGFAALAVDISYSLFQHRQMQNAADAASLAGARTLSLAQTDPTVLVTDGDIYGAMHEYASRNHAQTLQAWYIDGSGQPMRELIAHSAEPSPLMPPLGEEVGVMAVAGTGHSAFFGRVFGVEQLSAQAESRAMWACARHARDTVPFAVRQGSFSIGTPTTIWEKVAAGSSIDQGWVSPDCSNFPCTPDPQRLNTWMQQTYPGTTILPISYGGQVNGPGQTIGGSWVEASFASVSPGRVLLLPVFDDVYHYKMDLNQPEEFSGATTVFTDDPQYNDAYLFRIVSFAAFEVAEVRTFASNRALDGQFIGYVANGDWAVPSWEDALCDGVNIVKLIGPDGPPIFTPQITPPPLPPTATPSATPTWTPTPPPGLYPPCVVEQNGYTFEFLSMIDHEGVTTFTFRVTNHNSRALSNVAFELPPGQTALFPRNNGTYNAARSYNVENPTNNPFWSIKFETIGEGIKNGESDTFQYTVPTGMANVLTRMRVQAKSAKIVGTVTFTEDTCFGSPGSPLGTALPVTPSPTPSTTITPSPTHTPSGQVEGQVVLCAPEIVTVTLTMSERVPIDVVHVLDVSYSMSWGWGGRNSGGTAKISTAKSALIGFNMLLQPDKGDQVGLVSFGYGQTLGGYAGAYAREDLPLSSDVVA